MGDWRRTIEIAALAVLCLPGASRAEQAFPSHDVRIDVSVADAASVSVRERYLLDGPAGASMFELLENACSTIGPISASIDNRPFVLEASHRSPWTILRTTGGSTAGDGRELSLSYDVRLGGGVAVPIVLPSAVLGRAGESRGADVALRVEFGAALSGASVVLPRLERLGDSNAWQARLSAIPSVIHLGLAGSCDRALAGTTGGLEWRFWLFLATMAVWIPVYFWWFGRRGDLR